jgi:hypothetical protein
MDNRRCFHPGRAAWPGSFHLDMCMFFAMVAFAVRTGSAAGAFALHMGSTRGNGRGHYRTAHCRCSRSGLRHAHDLLSHTVGFLLKVITRSIHRQLGLQAAQHALVPDDRLKLVKPMDRTGI